MRAAYRIFLVSSVILAAIVFVFSFGLGSTEYANIGLLPMAMIVFLFMVGAVTWKTGPSTLVFVCSLVATARFTVFPLLTALNGGYVGRSLDLPAKSSFDTAIYLMCYELLAVGLLCVLMERRYWRHRKQANVTVRAIPGWYLAVISLVTLAGLVAVPSSRALINIGVPNVVADEFSSSAASVLFAMMALSALNFLFLKASLSLAKNRRWRRFTPWLALSLAIANVSVYFATGRLAILLSAIGVSWVLVQLFGRRAWTSIAVIGILAVLLFSIVTEARQFHQVDETRLERAANQVQAYTGGVYNVAIGVEVPEYFPEATTLRGLAFDFMRSTVGLNIIAQRWKMNYSNVYFNARMFTHVERRSQIMPMIAQGNLYLTPIFAPLLSVFFMLLGYLLMAQIDTSPYIEVRFALFISVVRLGMFGGQNSMNMMNFLSLYLIIPFTLLGVFMALQYMMRGAPRFKVNLSGRSQRGMWSR